MPYVELGSPKCREGLSFMLYAYLGSNEFVQEFTHVGTALFIIEIAKRSPDIPGWFPMGKWATIQAIQEKISIEIDKIVK